VAEDYTIASLGGYRLFGYWRFQSRVYYGTLAKAFVYYFIELKKL